MDLKKLIDEQADQDPDVAVAPDENSILDVALDLEQSLAEQGLVRGNEPQTSAPEPPEPSFLVSDADDEETIKATRLSAAVRIAKEGVFGGDEDERLVGSGKRRILDEEDKEEDRSVKKKTKRMLSDDEEDEEDEREPPLLPDVVNEDEAGAGARVGGEKALLENIFGGTSSDESIVEDGDLPGAKGKKKTKKNGEGGKKKKRRKKKSDMGRSDDLSGSDAEGKSSKPSDFEEMMQKKRKERSRLRRKTGIEVINARDQMVGRFIHEMSEAVEADRQANREGKPTTKTVALLPEVMRHLNNAELRSAFLDHDVLPVITNWLAPLPSRSLPYLKIRDGLLHVLGQMPNLDRDLLKDSCVGKAVMLLYRHPQETRANKRRAEKIIHEWARPIFGLKSDPKDLTREEREELDHVRKSQQAIRRRSSSGNDPVRRQSIESALKEEQANASKPGDPGWCSRARVPMPSVRDYVVRPQSIVDAGPARGAKRGELRQDKILKQFQEGQKKRNSTGAAYRVNLLGSFK